LVLLFFGEVIGPDILKGSTIAEEAFGELPTVSWVLGSGIYGLFVVETL
jgi:hypothetical protein